MKIKKNGMCLVWKYIENHGKTTLLKAEYSKTCVKRPLSKRPKMVFKTDYRLMQVKSIAESSKGSILQHLRPVLSYSLSLRPLCCLFLSGRFYTGFTVDEILILKAEVLMIYPGFRILGHTFSF